MQWASSLDELPPKRLTTAPTPMHASASVRLRSWFSGLHQASQTIVSVFQAKTFDRKRSSRRLERNRHCDCFTHLHILGRGSKACWAGDSAISYAKELSYLFAAEVVKSRCMVVMR